MLRVWAAWQQSRNAAAIAAESPIIAPVTDTNMIELRTRADKRVRNSPSEPGQQHTYDSDESDGDVLQQQSTQKKLLPPPPPPLPPTQLPPYAATGAAPPPQCASRGSAWGLEFPPPERESMNLFFNHLAEPTR